MNSLLDWLPLLIIGGVIFVVFLFLGLPPLLRLYVKSTGERATATILEKSYGRGVVYSGSSYNHNVVAQKIILKLEVHPNNEAAYLAEDRFMAKSMDVMRLNEGCNVQVSIARNNPKWVVSLPETVTASPDAAIQARVSMDITNFAERMSHGGGTGSQDVLHKFNAQGVRTNSSMPDDPKAKLEKLKEIFTSGFITQQEYEMKKAEILAKM